MSEFAQNYKIEDRGAGLCVVFNLKTGESGRTEAAFNETNLLARIKNVEGGGRTASLEKKALFDLQRQQQMKQKR